MNELKQLSTSVFARVFDAVVFGAGYAGFAAALRLHQAGKQVLLADLRGDLLWESGRAFWPETGEWTPDFLWFGDCVTRRSGIAGERMDGAMAELVANELIRDAKLPVLYNVAPVAVDWEGESLASVTLATPSGLRRVAARQWIDATETGLLARLLDPGLRPRAPAGLCARIFFQQRLWPHAGEFPLAVPESPDVRFSWEPSVWSNERAIRLEMPGREARFLRHILPALKAVRRACKADFSGGFVSHVSFEPYPIYAAGRAAGRPAANVVLAAPALSGQAIRTLVQRFELGRAAAAALADRPRCERAEKWLRRPASEPAAGREDQAEVAVAGLGTGGALAALAAARSGADVVAMEPLAFAGGVGTGGGIPVYYWGCPGGLQEEVDARVREAMPLFADRAAWPVGFHPDAKRVVLDDLLHAAGVRVAYGSLLASVETKRGRVESALVATPDGPRRVRARAWIDATGDGDLCAFAGARFALGRPGDGRVQPCTQSCGFFRLEKGRLINCTTNPDSGYADPTDAESLTRARIEGIHGLCELVFHAFNRLTYLTPLLGIRQGRRIDTDYRLTLDDLFERRRFPDVVGYTGMHYDNHASDYEFESDRAFFYVACAGLWSERTACEIPYRALLPKGLDNVWIACRAAGADGEAVHSFRVQRDIQRLGEVTGLAAALALKGRVDSRAVPYARLRERLEKSGALPLAAPGATDFGKAVGPLDFLTPQAAIPPPALLARDILDIRGPFSGRRMWRLYRAGKKVAGPGLKKALTSRDASESWCAAALFGAWGDRAAEGRLLRAIRTREVGPEHDPATLDPRRGSKRILPRWWVAVTLLRLCGGPRARAVLERLAGAPDLPERVQAAAALTRRRLLGY